MFGYGAQLAFFDHAGIGITDQQIVQVDQVLKFRQADRRPATGCTATSTSHEIRQAHGTDIIVTKNIVTNQRRLTCSGDLHDARRAK